MEIEPFYSLFSSSSSSPRFEKIAAARNMNKRMCIAFNGKCGKTLVSFLLFFFLHFSFSVVVVAYGKIILWRLLQTSFLFSFTILTNCTVLYTIDCPSRSHLALSFFAVAHFLMCRVWILYGLFHVPRSTSTK